MAGFRGFQPAALRFLRDLARNNEKAWFEANRDVYEREVRDPMRLLVETLVQDRRRRLALSPRRRAQGGHRGRGRGSGILLSPRLAQSCTRLPAGDGTAVREASRIGPRRIAGRSSGTLPVRRMRRTATVRFVRWPPVA
jgi:Conserved hypothetical protein (DUF2461)